MGCGSSCPYFAAPFGVPREVGNDTEGIWHVPWGRVRIRVRVRALPQGASCMAGWLLPWVAELKLLGGVVRLGRLVHEAPQLCEPLVDHRCEPLAYTSCCRVYVHLRAVVAVCMACLGHGMRGPRGHLEVSSEPEPQQQYQHATQIPLTVMNAMNMVTAMGMATVGVTVMAMVTARWWLRLGPGSHASGSVCGPARRQPSGGSRDWGWGYSQN